MRRVIFLIFVAALAASCTTEPRFVLKANIKDSDTLTFVLQKRTGQEVTSIDTAVSENGVFRMEGVIEYPQQVLLMALNTRNRVSFYIENTEINISGSLDSLFDASITGSKTQDEYKSFILMNKPLADKYQIIVSNYQNARATGDTARMSSARNEGINLEKEMSELKKTFIKSNPASYFTPTLIRNIFSDLEQEEAAQMIAALDTNVAKTQIIIDIKKELEAVRAVAIGQKAPDFTLNDQEGNPVSLSSKTGAKLLLVDFWASWCKPCRDENPMVVKTYKEFHKNGFDIFGVSLDQSKEEWVKAIADDKLTWTHVFDQNNDAANAYAVNAIPANFLLDQNGIIIAKNLRGEELYNKVKELSVQK
jgi:peroxiredoxin